MNLAPIQILLVEDNAADAALLTGELTQSSFGPFSVTHLKRLAEAISQIPRQPIDVVVLDLGLPDSQGLETLRELRRRIPPEIPVVVISGMRDQTLCVRALQEGADDYVIKGASDSLGARSIRYAVERRRERKQMEETIRQLNADLERRVVERTAQLQAANNELEAFSYSVSHDLRAPLRSLDGFSQALLEDYGEKLDPQGQEMLVRIRSASQRMGLLIDDLLNLSRVTRVEMSRDKVDLSKMAREVAEELRSAEPGRDAEFVIGDTLEAHADPHLLRIVLTNLLGNAWKFTSKRAQARIEFGCSRETDIESYFVRDNGAGFSMLHASKLFGAFQRLHGATEFPGTGIGLATVQRIVHRHGGRVWAEGKLDGGATFHFTLRPAPSSIAA